MRRLLLKNFALVYRASEWSRRRFTPAGMIVAGGALAAGTFGIDTRQSLAYQVSALLFAVLLVAILSNLRFRPRLSLERRLPRYVTAGQPFDYTVSIHNEGRKTQHALTLIEELSGAWPTIADLRPAPGTRRENWFDRLIGYPRWVAAVQRARGANVEIASVPAVAPGATVEATVHARALRRGYVRFARSWLARPDILGLVHALQRRDDPQSLLALPRRFPVPELRFPGRRLYHPGGIPFAGSVGDSQEFVSLRDYRPGDPVRRLHWRSWAKTGRPIVKEYQDEFFDRRALVLDTLSATTDQAFEDAISLAASFACGPAHPDQLMDLLFIGDRAVSVTAGRGLAERALLLEALACAELHGDRGFAPLAELVLGHGAQLSGAVCVFLEWDTARHELVSALRALGVDVAVFVVLAGEPDQRLDPGPLRDRPEQFMALVAGRVEEGLARRGDAPGHLNAAGSGIAA